MSDFLISLMFGVGIGVWVWTQLARGTGNSDPSKTFLGAGIVGLIALIFFYSLLKLVLHVG